MQRVYLDTQQYGNLVDDRSDLPLDLLRSAIANSEIAVVGSLEVLQEMMALAGPQRSLYTRQVELFEELAGNRILEPTDRRHLREHETGGLLSDQAAYLSRESRRSIQRGSRRRNAATAVAADAKIQKEEYAVAERRARAQILQRLADHDEKITPTAAQEWFASIDLDRWHQDVVEAGVSRELYTLQPGAATGIAQYPSSWVLNTYRLSRLVFTLGEGRKIQESDLSDAHHAACGMYCDVLVTDDKQFIATLDQIGPVLPYRWMRSADFAADLEREMLPTPTSE